MKFDIKESIIKNHPDILAGFYNLIREKAGSHCSIKYIGSKQTASHTYCYKNGKLTDIIENMDRRLFFEASQDEN